MAKVSPGLKPKIFKGLSKKRMGRGGGYKFPRVRFEDDKAVVVQFFDPPVTESEGFLEFDQHQWREGGNWNYVPCAGKKCPLCEDDDDDVAKVRYRFCALVYNLKAKEVQVMEGPTTLAQQIERRYAKRKKSFLKRTWDITRMSGQPTRYDVDSGDDDPVSLKAKKRLNLEEYVTEAMQRFFGDDVPSKTSRTALDDDDEYDEDDIDEDELMEMSTKKLKRIAKQYKVRTEDRTKKQIVKAIIKKAS